MRKYWVIYCNSLTKFLQYRLHLGLIFVSHIVSLTGLIALWLAIYHNGEHVGTYTLSAIITYYVLVAILRSAIADGVGIGFQVVSDIHEGFVTNYLVKPLSYTLEQFVKGLSQATINILFLTPIVILLYIIWGEYVPHHSVTGWLSFFVMVAIASVLFFLIYFLVALISFWVEKGRSFIYGILVISMLFNGTLLPLDLFPAWSQPIIHLLPFRYLLFVPVDIFLHPPPSLLPVLIPSIVWIGIFTLGISCVWRLGVRRFDAVGR